MTALTLDRAANILLLALPAFLVTKIINLLGLCCCCSTLFVTSWFLGGSIYLIFCSLRYSSEGKAVLVTGCDTGFGYKAALELHNLGFTVFAGCLLADKNGEGAQSLKGLNSKRMFVLQLNVTSQEQAISARKEVDKVLAEEKSLIFWGIINNAGLGTFGELEWTSLTGSKNVADVNIFGTINVIQKFLPLIRRSKGRVINVSSMLGRMTAPMRSAYVLTKFAVGGLSDCLRQELRHWGVKVIVVEPGNFIAGTSIYTEKKVEELSKEMWEAMSDETKADYGEEVFQQRVAIMKTYINAGESDLSPVVQAFTDALLQKYPQRRYQPMELYYKIRVFCAWHLPGWIYDLVYMGPPTR